jgi:hypothetical protein
MQTASIENSDTFSGVWQCSSRRGQCVNAASERGEHGV